MRQRLKKHLPPEPAKSLWNELAPEVFADSHDPILTAMRGAVVIVRLNDIDAHDELVGYEILAGRLIRANREEGFVLSMVGTKAGETLNLPLVPGAFKLIPPGRYGLSDDTIVTDPDFQVAFDIYRPNN
ncbi:hypothetical protein OVA03_10220 [Asticcacaulis sp. SL142]|uniref:hypothetical protein n=1 Tax=Asticcacaulis sp. SL142 TaxID=2995155 RepID=UPI00226CA90A|nr:hypothetical protein [Asticcacaulis sp. SL142]WAC47085.1 hypothetical protein OVA03_10220 [Asticcacaulis sp. SL142]